VREDKILIQVDRLLVVLSGLAEFGLNEVELCAVIVDVRVVLVLGEGGFEVSFGGGWVCCGLLWLVQSKAVRLE
jgi:hypothetical protein